MAVVPAPGGGRLTEEMLAELERLLTRRQLEVICLRYVEGIRTDKLVAEHLGITRSAASYRRRNALRRIQRSGLVRIGGA